MKTLESIDHPALARVTALFSCIDSENWEGLSDLFHKDITYKRPGYDPFVGRSDVMKFYRGERIIKSGKHHVETVTTQEGNVICMGHFTGVSKDDKPLNVDFADYYNMSNDLSVVKERKTFFYAPLI